MKNKACWYWCAGRIWYSLLKWGNIKLFSQLFHQSLGVLFHLSFLFLNYFLSLCSCFSSQKLMNNLIILFIKLWVCKGCKMHFHKFTVYFKGLILSRGAAHVRALDWDKRRGLFPFSLFSLSPLFSPLPSATHLFSGVINTATGRSGHYAFPVEPSPELWSPAQDGSALPASLQLSIERSIKVYLHICQLQWAVWWALIGQVSHWALHQLSDNIIIMIINNGSVINNHNNKSNNKKWASVTANPSFLRGILNWVQISPICLSPWSSSSLALPYPVGIEC